MKLAFNYVISKVGVIRSVQLMKLTCFCCVFDIKPQSIFYFMPLLYCRWVPRNTLGSSQSGMDISRLLQDCGISSALAREMPYHNLALLHQYHIRVCTVWKKSENEALSAKMINFLLSIENALQAWESVWKSAICLELILGFTYGKGKL